MKQNLLLLLCLTGVFPTALCVLQSVPHFYYLVKTPKTWSDAKTYCRQNYDDIATVNSTDDFTRLQNEAKINSFYAVAWVGLYNNINTWRWSYQNVTPVYKNWYFTEPNNYAGREACGALDIYGNWWDLNCAQEKPFLCYNANFTDADRFIEIADQKSWTDAQAYCQEYYTDLASINNVSDNLQLKNKVRSEWSDWIGLFRDGWKWADQSNVSNIRWMAGQPDNWGGNQNCAVVYNGQFVDEACISLYPFFCHIVPPVTEKQIVKVRVKSGLDVSDPALRTSIKEQFEQQLVEQGLMENTTLTWRIQEDGSIFYKTKEESEDNTQNNEDPVCHL